jgi:hypothetical protein
MLGHSEIDRTAGNKLCTRLGAPLTPGRSDETPLLKILPFEPGLRALSPGFRGPIDAEFLRSNRQSLDLDQAALVNLSPDGISGQDSPAELGATGLAAASSWPLGHAACGR